VRLLTRTGLDWTKRFRPIAEALADLPIHRAYIDGEVAALDEQGISNFGALQDALSKGHAERLVYIAFDLLHLDGLDLRELPLVDRKEALQRLLRRAPRGIVQYSGT
jgi:bifunctional non-homologous end joining protein LigD